MTNDTLKWLGAGTMLAVAFVSRPAAAAPHTADSLQLGAGFRYGFDQDDRQPNQWGLGLGAEAGYTFSNALYLGANFDYFFGEKVELGNETSLELGMNVWQLMGEVGYDDGFGRSVVLRPKFGFGLAHLGTESCYDGRCTNDSSRNFAFAPGIALIVKGGRFTFSFDVRYDIVLEDADSSKAIILTAGLGF